MLPQTKRKLDSYYSNEPQLGSGGTLHPIDKVTRIQLDLFDAFHGLHDRVRPDLSVETGLAYGFSTLAFLDNMHAHGYGHHISIDPYQNHYDGVGLAAVEQLGFSDRFTWMNDRSDQSFTRLAREKKRSQLIYFDGLHTFDGILTDFLLADQILDEGGMMVINDMWLPAVRSVASFISCNRSDYQVVPGVHRHIFVVQKRAADTRAWNHFAPFDGSGADDAERAHQAPRSVLRRLLGS